MNLSDVRGKHVMVRYDSRRKKFAIRRGGLTKILGYVEKLVLLGVEFDTDLQGQMSIYGTVSSDCDRFMHGFSVRMHENQWVTNRDQRIYAAQIAYLVQPEDNGPPVIFAGPVARAPHDDFRVFKVRV